MGDRRTDERDTQWDPTAHRDAAGLFGTHSRKPSGPAAVIVPHHKAGHMTALAPTPKSATAPLPPRGRPRMGPREGTCEGFPLRRGCDSLSLRRRGGVDDGRSAGGGTGPVAAVVAN